MAANDGGPAYPHTRNNEENGAAWTEQYDGMSLRDRFAMMDIPVDENGDWLGWFTGKSIVEAFGKCPESKGFEQLEWLAMVEAKIRYMRADAMLRERERIANADQPQ